MAALPKGGITYPALLPPHVHKASWGVGPWVHEPDEAQWSDPDTRFPCAILRSPFSGALNGYVGVPLGHPLFGKQRGDRLPPPLNFAERTLDDRIGIVDLFLESMEEHFDGRMPLSLILHVHGGCTYSDQGLPVGKPDALWWFGFDCAHGGDYCPAMMARIRELMPEFGESTFEVYRDWTYVTNEVRNLARQLKAFGPQ